MSERAKDVLVLKRIEGDLFRDTSGRSNGLTPENPAKKAEEESTPGTD